MTIFSEWFMRLSTTGQYDVATALRGPDVWDLDLDVIKGAITGRIRGLAFNDEFGTIARLDFGAKVSLWPMTQEEFNLFARSVHNLHEARKNNMSIPGVEHYIRHLNSALRHVAPHSETASAVAKKIWGDYFSGIAELLGRFA